MSVLLQKHMDFAKAGCFTFSVWLISSLSAVHAAVPGVAPEMELMLRQCAPNVHPETMAAVVRAESGGQQFAIADAGPTHLPWSQRKSMVRSFYLPSVTEAVTKAQSLIANGHTVSLGPAQINDRQLPRLGLSIEQVFEPCTNLRAGGQILGECYSRASKRYGAGPRALRAALSCYNSGDMERGDREGYVDLIFSQRGHAVSLRAGGPRASDAGAARRTTPKLEASSGRPWWKNVGNRSFTMSSREFTTE